MFEASSVLGCTPELTVKYSSMDINGDPISGEDISTFGAYYSIQISNAPSPGKRAVAANPTVNWLEMHTVNADRGIAVRDANPMTFD